MKYIFEDDWMIWPEDPDILVSNSGRVLSHKRGYWYELHQSLLPNGYLQVGIGYGPKSQPRSVHRLVAETFIYNSDPINKNQVNHIDGDKLNNFFFNLEWVTRNENLTHAFRIGIQGTSPVIPIKVVETGEIYPSQAECARQINGDQRNIALCLADKREKHKGYHFEYVDEEVNDYN